MIRNRIFTLLLPALLAGSALAQSETYSALALFDSQPGAIYINGFPVFEDDGSSDGSTAHTSIINQFVIQGENIIRIETPAPTPSPGLLKLRVERGPAQDEARIDAFTIERETREPSPGIGEIVRLLAENGFDAEARGQLDGQSSRLEYDTGGKSYTYSQSDAGEPNQITIRFEAANVPLVALPWAGESPELTAADEVAIRALVSQTHAALRAEDSAAVLALIANKTTRLATALRVTVPEMESNLLQIWQLLFDDAGFAFDDLDAPGLRFEALPDANLVRITKTDGSPPICGSGPGKEFTLPLFVSKLDGTWTIVD